ncbi:hypothetical protein D3C75_895410 [compost metagenome]
MGAFEADFAHLGVDVFPGLSDVAAYTHHIQHTASGSDDFPVGAQCRSCMKDHGLRADLIQTADGQTGRIRARVTRRCQHHTNGSLIGPFDLQLVQSAVQGGQHNIHQIGFQLGQQHLGFGVAETGVELDGFDTLSGQHQPGIKDALEGAPFLDQSLCHGAHDVGQCFLDHRLRDMGQRGIGAHSAGVGSLIIIEDLLMVLGGSHGLHRGAVHKG